MNIAHILYYLITNNLKPYFLGYKFQENLLKTMIAIENTFFELADSVNQNCLVICDRGVMDASACMFLISSCPKNYI